MDIGVAYHLQNYWWEEDCDQIYLSWKANSPITMILEAGIKIFKEKQKSDFDHQHGVHALSWFHLANSDIWITSGEQPSEGAIISSTNTPQLYTHWASM